MSNDDSTERYSQLAIRVHGSISFRKATDDVVIREVIKADSVESRTETNPAHPVEGHDHAPHLHIEVESGSTSLFDFATGLKQQIDASLDAAIRELIEAAGVVIRTDSDNDPIYQVQERDHVLHLHVEVDMGSTSLFDFATGLKQRLNTWLNEGHAEPLNWVVEVEAEHVTVEREGLIIQ